MTAKFTSNLPPTTLLAYVVGFKCITFHIFLRDAAGCLVSNNSSLYIMHCTFGST